MVAVEEVPVAAAGIATPARSAEQRPWKTAGLYMLALGLFFAASYSLANWVTGHRGHVPSLVFRWEHDIPFLSWTIVPYWSIDLFYCLSFFICRTRAELNQHARRLLTAQLVCVTAFLLLPLRFAFQRPQAPGVFGWMFDALARFDAPFNQAPSLHLSLAVILAARYSAHLAGPARWLLRAWFVLIGASVLTTYQHHFIDVPTGIWVGALCRALFSDQPVARLAVPTGRYWKLSLLYLVAVALLSAVAIQLGGWAWWLLWPAGSCLIVSGIYGAGDPALFRRDAIQWLLAPYTAVVWLNSRWWTRHEPVASEVTDGVWLGRVPSGFEREALGISSMMSLAAELPLKAGQVKYLQVPVLDMTVPLDAQLDRAVAAIESLEAYRPTLVCCALGYSRSAAAVTAWLVATRRASSVGDAIARIECGPRCIVLTAAHWASLRRWAEAGRCV
jgi:protein-tyrosine phosphatase